MLLNAQTVEIQQQGKPTSIRGLSVVDNNIAWISGSSGYIATTADAGKNWNWAQVKGYEKADFRDIEAFSDKEAIIMSSGTPAVILKTTDGGKSWQEKYKNADTSFFFDAMDFTDKKHGYILGDPINGKFLMMETKDGGENWTSLVDGPVAIQAEAAFAASGTCFRTIKNSLVIVSGGSTSNFISGTNAANWKTTALPILKGKSSEGAFSIAAHNKNLVVVGGDYQHDKRTDSTTCYSANGGLNWQPAQTQPAGYQSCVEYVSDNTFVSTGTSGSNITTDNGKTWKKIDGVSFNVCRRAKRGNLILYAGDRGKIGILKF